jgi:hypothetical protein
MKRRAFFSVLFLLLIAFSIKADQIRMVTDSDLNPFKTVIRNKDMVSVQFPDQGIRWVIKLESQGIERVSNYNEVISLKIGEKLELKEKHSRISVQPVYMDKSLVLQLDLTSNRQSLKDNIYFIPVKDEQN